MINSPTIANSRIWELYYQGERIFPASPLVPNMSQAVTNTAATASISTRHEPFLPIPRNRAERRAAEARKRTMMSELCASQRSCTCT
jgi:hypothetical protein